VSRHVRVRLVIISVLNPFGFPWSRRVDEDNVDLNRNLYGPELPSLCSKDIATQVACVLTSKLADWLACSFFSPLYSPQCNRIRKTPAHPLLEETLNENIAVASLQSEQSLFQGVIRLERQ
jgi:hypothetical protein